MFVVFSYQALSSYYCLTLSKKWSSHLRLPVLHRHRLDVTLSQIKGQPAPIRRLAADLWRILAFRQLLSGDIFFGNLSFTLQRASKVASMSMVDYAWSVSSEMFHQSFSPGKQWTKRYKKGVQLSDCSTGHNFHLKGAIRSSTDVGHRGHFKAVLATHRKVLAQGENMTGVFQHVKTGRWNSSNDGSMTRVGLLGQSFTDLGRPWK